MTSDVQTQEITLTVFPFPYPEPPQGEGGVAVEFLGSRRLKVDPDAPLALLAQQEFQDRYPEWNEVRNAPDYSGNIYEIRVGTSTSSLRGWPELEAILVWEDSSGIARFSGEGLRNKYGDLGQEQITLADLQRSFEAGYIKNRPTEIYLIPLMGLGSGGGQLLIDFLTELLWFGASWVATDFLPSPRKLIKRAMLTRRARKLAEDFHERGVRATADIRRWAATRESWTTYLGAKKLGVDRDVMESIFVAMGYQLDYDEQTWRLGDTKKYRKQQARWRAGEKSRMKNQIREERKAARRSP